jgi:hypothetical protein
MRSRRGARQEDEILLGERPIEAERRGGARDLALVGLRVDEDVDRVADGVDARENQQRHDREHGEAL